MAERFDVVVIGGGPAGCAAAITAARRGRNVLLLERGKYPRHKVCGEFVSAESLGLLQELLGPSEMLDRAPRISRTRVFLHSGEFVASIEPAAASITRRALDIALWEAAAASGVHARQDCGHHLVEVGAEHGGYRLAGDVGDIVCDRVIWANGRRTNLSASSRLIGIKAHFRVEEPLKSVDLYFGENGYCGVQPIAEPHLVNACALVDVDAVKNAGNDRMRAAFDVHEKLRGERWQQVTETVVTAQLHFAEPQPLRNGMICAGDAAGFIDPFLGDGISLALQSGALAGECEEAAEYESEYRRRFLPVFRRASRLRKLLSAPTVLQKPALLLLKWPGVARAVVDGTRANARSACLLRAD